MKNMKEGRRIPTSRKLKIQNIKKKLNLVHLFDHFYLRRVSLEASLTESSVDVNVALHLVFQKGSKKRFNKITYDILQGRYQKTSAHLFAVSLYYSGAPSRGAL